MTVQDEFRDALATLDVEKAQAIWSRLNPGQPVGSEEQALASLHMARSAAEFLPLRARAYSHAWLLECGHTSLLPDHLRPKAQRMYPVIAMGIGISVKGRINGGPLQRAALVEIRTSMENAVLEAQSDGKLADAEHVKERMQSARRKTIDKLFG